MGLCAKLFGWKRIVLDDPDFGRISYNRQEWASEPPCDQYPYAVFLTAPESGPTPGQREFFRNFKADFTKFDARGQRFVDRHRKDQSPISVYALCIGPEQELAHGQFVIEYSDAQADTIYGAGFDGWEPIEYYEDD